MLFLIVRLLGIWAALGGAGAKAAMAATEQEKLRGGGHYQGEVQEGSPFKQAGTQQTTSNTKAAQYQSQRLGLSIFKQHQEGGGGGGGKREVKKSTY